MMIDENYMFTLREKRCIGITIISLKNLSLFFFKFVYL